MREITIADELREKAPEVKLGVLSASVVATGHAEGLWAEIDACVAALETLLAATEIATIPEIAATRRAYKALGKDPSRYRGSAEALLRRIAQGKGLYRVSTIVDANNLVSLETYHSIGLYDVRFLSGPVAFRPGRAGETYAGIAKGEINLEGLPVFADDEGPFGNPSSDSARTRVREDTTEVLMAIVAFAGAARLDAALARAAELLGRYASATGVETRVV